MSEEKFDPWQSLAAELGVDASKMPAPPPAPVQPTRQPATSNSPPPAPKPSADWLALAGELGIEVPVEPEQPLRRADPVADLLGFVPPSSAAVEREEERPDRPRHERREGRFEDRSAECNSWD